MDSGEGYHRDVEYKVSIRKHLSGGIVLSVDGIEAISTMRLSLDDDISSCIERLGKIMRDDFDVFYKDNFLEWVHESEPVNP